jgi:molybdopterin/thiamine biosynthesis adenylyltransferase
MENEIENSESLQEDLQNPISSLCELMEANESARYLNSFGQLEGIKTVDDLLKEIRTKVKNTEPKQVQEEKVSVLSSEEFYKVFTASASKFVEQGVQEKFRRSNVLVGGAGSIGNPIAMMAVRSGAENITIADPDVVEDSNLARQEYLKDQVGKNKAEMTVENMSKINPYAKDKLKSIPEGITKENVEELVKNSDIIIDGIDIRAADMSWELHKYACQYKKPVIVGYDMAGTAMVAVYRYDKDVEKVLNGEISEETIEEFKKVKSAYKEGRIKESEFLNYVYDTLTGPINPLKVPVEQFKELISRDSNDTRTYQDGTTSRLLSALTIETMRKIYAGEEVKKIITLDLPSSVRRFNPTIFTKVGLMLKALNVVNKRGAEVKDMTNKLK